METDLFSMFYYSDLFKGRKWNNWNMEKITDRDHKLQQLLVKIVMNLSFELR